MKLAALHLKQTPLLVSPQDSTHGFLRQAQVAANIAARHRQVKLTRRTASSPEAIRHGKQETRYSRLSRSAQQLVQTQPLFVNRLTDGALKTVAKLREPDTQFFEPIERKLAERGSFKCRNRARIAPRANGITADDVSGEPQRCHEAFASLHGGFLFQAAGTHDVQAGEGSVLLDQYLTFFQPKRRIGDSIEL